jgi:hypothetical protein
MEETPRADLDVGTPHRGPSGGDLSRPSKWELPRRDFAVGTPQGGLKVWTPRGRGRKGTPRRTAREEQSGSQEVNFEGGFATWDP